MGTRRLKRYEYYSEEELASLSSEDRAIVMQDARQRGLVDAQGNKVKKPKNTGTEQVAGQIAGTAGGYYVGSQLAQGTTQAAAQAGGQAAAQGAAQAGSQAAAQGAAQAGSQAATQGAAQAGGQAAQGSTAASIAPAVGAAVGGAYVAYEGYRAGKRRLDHSMFNIEDKNDLARRGIETFDVPFYKDAREAMRADLPSDYVGYDKDGKWVNNKFINSRDEMDLEPEDIMNSPSFSRLYGNDWVKASPEARRAIAEEALKRGLVSEQKLLHYRVMDDKGLDEYARKYGLDANNGVQGGDRRYNTYDGFGGVDYKAGESWVTNPDGTRKRVISDGTGDDRDSRIGGNYANTERKQQYDQTTEEELDRYKRRIAAERAAERGYADPYTAPVAPTSTANQAAPAPVAGTGAASPQAKAQTGSLVSGPSQTTAQAQQIAAAGVKSSNQEQIPEDGYITVETGPSPQVRSMALGMLQSPGQRPQASQSTPTFQNLLTAEEQPIQISSDINPEGETDRERFGSLQRGQAKRFGMLANPLVYS